LNFFKQLEKINKKNNQIIIFWYYEEDDNEMLEAGEDYAKIVNAPFNIISYKE
jgi:hypothetical protein